MRWRWRWWEPPEPNLNDLWEAFPYMRGRAYVELYPPLHPVTGEYLPAPGPAVARIMAPPLIRPDGTLATDPPGGS